MSESFFSRWSRRKQAASEQTATEPSPSRAPTATPGVADGADAPERTVAAAQDAAPASDQPLPTLEDVRSLTPQSDFQPFMQRGVGSEVRNAAMKKLFADPHFNVMDGLDIYIDDYGQPDPLPAGMLEQMTSIDGLNLFNDKEKGDTSAGQPEVLASSDVAQSNPSDNLPTTQRDTPAHDHADLRLQPNPAARPEGAEPKPE